MSDGPERAEPDEPEGHEADAKTDSRFEWIGTLSIVIALYVWQHGLPPVYPGDIVALAAIGLMLVWFLRRRGKRQLAGEQQASERIAFRLGQTLKRIIRSF
jgi:membrane protein implicated in regulation of membrane protease activity